ncbi:MAG: KilA-N domain-containing protein [Okeania sp. SIO1H6]|uniref:KilA-N domain-containing protein n=1 Tax=Okeania hirsuta TaxID=1458930 RepID=A0A3N6PFE8_9CYAN|nr:MULTISPECIES: KilA-N domain-containing protein [Okeania]NET13191.1 KilA-N domain-containing protein [Okeania sp. SIO1H6]NES79616.1 KilA-N domain-containing protein [Okeania sp. SIO1H4]NET23277.1 KilA-N domain-containing protein [Okeania sp. SIO1H5]NET76623.1 KilA-N domain-containing protein [Okeania sp. SIO1F9]NET96841.1 KilA-N domain-containing protein [Okeania sp. SIO1H2]
MHYIEHSVGELVVTQRHSDGYINATKLARAYKNKTGKYKNPNSWFEKDRTNEYIELLSDKTRVEVYHLVEKKEKVKINKFGFILSLLFLLRCGFHLNLK